PGRRLRGRPLADPAGPRTDALPEAGGGGQGTPRPSELRPGPLPGDPGRPRALALPLLPDLPAPAAAAGGGRGDGRGLRPGVDARARGAAQGEGGMSEPAAVGLSRPLVRLAGALLGTAILAVTVWSAGAKAVLAGLGSSVHALPALALLEAVMVV